MSVTPYDRRTIVHPITAREYQQPFLDLYSHTDQWQYRFHIEQNVDGMSYAVSRGSMCCRIIENEECWEYKPQISFDKVVVIDTDSRIMQSTANGICKIIANKFNPCDCIESGQNLIVRLNCITSQ